jgi:acetoin utilization deacetylase AcuC-like enzyme
MATGLCTDERFRDHVPPSQHPERPERLVAIERALDEVGLRARCVAIAAREATRAELVRAHGESHLDTLDARLAEGSGWIDDDTYFSPGSGRAARLAAGAAIELAQAVARGTVDNAIGFVRPPGHHATRDRAMGFCLYNNVAVAAAALRVEGARVAIVDFDVHHGNGTEDIFAADPDVLYVSTHQFPFYPGTGRVESRGEGRGLGATVNVPLPSGSGPAAYALAFDRVVLPAIERFGADIVLVSAGFDAHRRDPLASMNLDERAYAELTLKLLDISRGRLAALLEGGYDLDALAASACAMLSALLGDPSPGASAVAAPATPSEIAAVERARRELFA